MGRKRVLILGNGFDLDLGRKTAYSHFAESIHWPFSPYQEGLASRLGEAASVEKWFDIESLLKKYAMVGYNQMMLVADPAEDRNTFIQLQTRLMDYLKEEQQKPVDKDSAAWRLLDKIVETNTFDEIYTFNYTFPPLPYKQPDKNYRARLHYVHGSLEDSSIILGVEDACELRDGYQYLYKTFSRHYKSVELKFDLDEAEEVVFFGHSLGETDYHYFDEFFHRCVNSQRKRKDKIKLRFFVRDDVGREEVLDRIRRLNENKTDRFFMLNDVQFIHTQYLKNDGAYNQKFEAYLSYLEENRHFAAMLDGQFIDWIPENSPI